MSLDDLRLFVAVARERSFTAAARRAGVPTSTLSRRIATLEDALGVRLLHRTSRSVGLTGEGERLLARAGGSLDELLAAVDRAADRDAEPAGRIRITAPVLTGTTRIAPVLFAFAAAHPRVTVELDLSNRVASLIEDGYDLAIRVGPIRDRELIARRLWTAPQRFLASPAFVRDRLGGRTRLTRDQLEALPAIVTRPAAWRLVRRDGSLDQVRGRDRIVVNDPRVAIAAAVAGLGVVCTSPEAAAPGPDDAAPGLVELTIAGRRTETRDLFVVYPSRAHQPARVRAVLAWLLAAAARPAPDPHRAR
ncbi:MAG TPA: LysR family transcriptional regulator [Kofleriaceae bacterium]|nr:LysR family transcriptional regulator [Kofleriaceae bacterium]